MPTTRTRTTSSTSLLDGKNIAKANNVNLALFDDPSFTERMESAAKLEGAARYATYGQLDVDLMRDAAPWIPLYNPNNRLYVSARVGCFTSPPPMANIDLAVACLK